MPVLDSCGCLKVRQTGELHDECAYHKTQSLKLEQRDQDVKALTLRLSEQSSRLEEALEGKEAWFRDSQVARRCLEETQSRLGELSDAVRHYLDNVSTNDGAAYEDVVRLRKLTAVETSLPKVPAELYTDEPAVHVDVEHPLFEPIWQAIKEWDIERERGRGYASATGTDVQTIIRAIERQS